ncbi:hypothetical protein [Mycobacterium hippophais]|uniref:hypothetical protein n=1 Tax=Mycobacterium hippophais TaxID=3016340 RepID=UPI0022B88B6D|nr:hypothetical protein [Mycobacterium hippophais]
MPPQPSMWEKSLDAAITKLANGTTEEKLVKKAACSALQTPPPYNENQSEWEQRIRSYIPDADESGVSGYAIDYALDRVTSPLAGMDTYGGVYFRVCAI